MIMALDEHFYWLLYAIGQCILYRTSDSDWAVNLIGQLSVWNLIGYANALTLHIFGGHRKPNLQKKG